MSNIQVVHLIHSGIRRKFYAQYGPGAEKLNRADRAQGSQGCGSYLTATRRQLRKVAAAYKGASPCRKGGRNCSRPRSRGWKKSVPAPAGGTGQNSAYNGQGSAEPAAGSCHVPGEGSRAAGRLHTDHSDLGEEGRGLKLRQTTKASLLASGDLAHVKRKSGWRDARARRSRTPVAAASQVAFPNQPCVNAAATRVAPCNRRGAPACST